MAVARVNVPKTAQRGEVIEIRKLISHVMETGYRRDYLGKTLPRDIITEFKCTVNGAEVCRAVFHPAISANTVHIFPVRVTESGHLQFTWTGDNGFTQTETAPISVA